MESMTIHLLSVDERDGQIRARAHVNAQDARITVEVTFAAHPEAPESELWDRARDEVLRYLDLA